MSQQGQSIMGALTDNFHSVVRDFIRQRDIPAAALAVTQGSQLKLAFGYWNTERDGFPVNENSLFRIASISKPLTATAVLRLMQDGKLNLDDKILPILGLTPPPPPADDNKLEDVTVRHLLNHTGGWRIADPADNRGAQTDPHVVQWLDPMFLDHHISLALNKPLPISFDDIILFMTRRGLWWKPGLKYDYCNYGYCLLGRIIEAKTGQAYGDYVRAKILTPLGITRTRLGRSLMEHRAPGEVDYYTRGSGLLASVHHNSAPPLVMQAYGQFNLENMDAHGGWLSTAVDLVRFASAFDNPSDNSILNRNSVNTMFAKPPGPVYAADEAKWYGCGWNVSKEGNTTNLNTEHNGELPGTRTILKRRADGVTFAVLLNKRDVKNDSPVDLDGLNESEAQKDLLGLGWNIEGMIEKVINDSGVSSFPAGDLFPTYYP